MIRIKAVDAQNILDVCALTTIQDDRSIMIEGHLCCNAVFIAEAKYHPEMYPNAIYNNHALIGFFVYKRTENQTDTATICRFMIDNKFQQKGLEEKAFEHILKGLKIQGVKKVAFVINNADESAKTLCLSFGFHFTGKIDKVGYYYKLEM